MMMQNEENLVQEVLVTRQPIFDKKKDVYAYQLLFKPGFGEQAKLRREADEEALKAVDGFLLNGLKTLSGGKKAFVNFNSDMIVTEFPLMFPSKLLGVEMRNKPEIGQKVTNALKKIKKAGYPLMLEDAEYPADDEAAVSLLQLADIIGSDFRSTDLPERIKVLKEQKVTKARFLAVSVETATDYSVALGKGYQYFQGGFFSKADLLPMRNIPSFKMNLLKILKEINKPKVQFDRIENILKKDVSITYKLLRFINSAKFSLNTTVQSIRHALTMLGEMKVRKWLSLIVLSGTGTDKPQELVKNTIIRAKFCESIASELDREKELQKYFLMGMFSMVEAFLDRPMDEILGELPLDPKVKAALLGEENRFRDVLDVVLDYEKGDWKNLTYSAEKSNLDVKKMVALYLDAVEWAKMF
jgi:EAL and modified HD-GYP domain-containing signal transduction protein